MKNRCFLLLLCFLQLFLCAGTSAEAPLLTAVEMTRLMGNGINLGNTMEACNNGKQGGFVTENTAFYETMWGQPVTTPEMLREMKAAGFDTVRLPVAWMTNATRLSEGDWTIFPGYLNRVEEIVNYALDAGMYVIVNDHWDGGWWGMFGSDTEATRTLAMAAYTGMWEQIAERFASYDERLIFESANEELGARFDENAPLYCQDSTDHSMPESERYVLTNRINQVFVDTVRRCGGHNADRFLLIAGYGTDITKTFDSRFQMPKDSVPQRLMLSVHYYDPTAYCLASSAKGAVPWGKKKDYETMYASLSRLKKFTAAGYGVVIGEYGALPGSDGIMKENAPAYHRAFLDCCDALDLMSCLWDCSGFFVRKAGRIVQEEIAEVYTGRNAASEAGKDYSLVAAEGRQSFDQAAAAAPEKFASTVEVTDSTCIAWLMFNEGSYALTYSVGDLYAPDSATPGVKASDAKISGEGTYTVSLDFTGTQQGYANNTAFCAVGITNGEQLYPGYCIHVKEVRINGEAVKLKGRNYTCSDDGKCTRSNLFNEWVDMKQIGRDNARVLYGDLTGISATPLNRELPCMRNILTFEVEFLYGPR